MKKVAIFDMDGTIIDSMGKWSTVLEDYLNNIGLVLNEEYKKQFHSMPMINILNIIDKDFGLKESPEKSFHNILEIMRQSYLDGFNLKPGVKEALDEMKNRNIKMAVATATPESIAIDAIRGHGLEKYFEFIQTIDNVNLRKSEDDYWKIAAKNLNSNIENSIVFEDALYCIETVSRLNGNIVAIADDSAKDDKNKILELSDYYINHYNELDMNIF